jgi:hypothetical protein
MQRTYLKIVLYVLRYVSSIPENLPFTYPSYRLYRSEEDMPPPPLSLSPATYILPCIHANYNTKPPPKRINNSQSTYLVILLLNCSPF